MDAGVFESAPVQSPPGSHHRPGAHHRDRNRVLSFPQNAGGTAEKESLVAFRASTELSRGRDSGRRPFLGAPSRLSSDRTGGSVISTLEEKDSYDVGGAKSDGHGGAESSCQKQHSNGGAWRRHSERLCSHPSARLWQLDRISRVKEARSMGRRGNVALTLKYVEAVTGEHILASGSHGEKAKGKTAETTAEVVVTIALLGAPIAALWLF